MTCQGMKARRRPSSYFEFGLGNCFSLICVVDNESGQLCFRVARFEWGGVDGWTTIDS
jgi:hypothetical protein